MTANKALLILLIGLSISLSTIALEVGDQAPDFTLEATDGNTYTLKGAEELTPEQREALINLCMDRIDAFEAKRGEKVWEHRKRGHSVSRQPRWYQMT